MHPVSPLIHLKGTTQTSHCNPLDVILSLSLQSTLKEKEGKEEENSSIVKLFTSTKTHISCKFCFDFFFVGNTCKFCYEKKLQEIAANFFAKYFV